MVYLINQGLSQVSRDDRFFQSINDQFRKKWLKGKVPNVIRIYRTLIPSTLRKAFLNYSNSVERELENLNLIPKYANATKKGPSNINRRYHGTKSFCGIGINGSTLLCSFAQCNVCQIIKGGFKIEKYSQGTGKGRYGKGIYFSATGGKSNDYVKHWDENGKTSIMFVAKVVVGSAKKTDTDWYESVTLPLGRHSVIADPDNVKTLNYDEVVVYRNDAAIPCYVIEYER